jgi:hypothetical protein
VNSSQKCDNSGAGTQALPLCSVQVAADAAVPGETIAIGYSARYPALTITHSGTATAPITFTSYGLTEPLINQSITVSGVQHISLSKMAVIAPGGQTAIQVNGSSDVSLDNVGIGHSGTQTPTEVGIGIDGTSSGVTVSRAQFTLDDGPFVKAAPGASRITVTTNSITSTAQQVIVLDGVTDAAVTSNSLSTRCGSDIVLDANSSAVLENNTIATGTGSGCTDQHAGLSVSADSVDGVRSDYNAYQASGSAVDESWGGTTYATATAFHAATGQGEHDLDFSSAQTGEQSPLIDSADANAPGELSTDVLGNPRVDDPLVADTGVGQPAPDRGAKELQDKLTFTDNITPPAPTKAVAPVAVSVTIPSPATSGWSEPIAYTVDFGDGSASVPIAAGGTASHTYQTPGVYTETTTATDTGGSRATHTYPVTVGTATPPRASLTVGPLVLTSTWGQPTISPGDVRLTISYSDPWEVASAVINWGDGSTDQARTSTSFDHSYQHMGSYPVSIMETDLLGRTSTATALATVGDEFLPMNPQRVYDSREYGFDSLPATGILKLSLDQLGAGFSGVDAAVVNVTVTDAKAGGYVDVYPDGTAPPTTSDLDYAAGQTVANHTLALAGSDGIVDFANHSTGPVDIIIDRVGIETHGQGAYTYQPQQPVRLLDTRGTLGGASGPVRAGGSVTIQVAGTNGVPADAGAVVLNLTVTDTKSAGYVTAWGHGTDMPGVSNTDWAAGQTTAALAVVGLTDGKVTLYNSGPGTADFIADLAGYYEYGTASVFLPAPQPVRLLDTRTGKGTAGHIAKLQPGQTLTLPVAGQVSAPTAGVSAVEINLTATNATAVGYISAYPDGTPRPTTSNLLYAAGTTTVNRAITQVGTDGAIDLYNGSTAPVDLIVDLDGGYYQYPTS